MTLRIMVEYCYAVSFMATVVHAECRQLALYAECQYAKCHYAWSSIQISLLGYKY
jgi:hypothetical protein